MGKHSLTGIALLAAAAISPGYGAAQPGPKTAFVHAIEFPYAEEPRQLWERELTWMKNIGITAVAFPIPEVARPDDPRSDLEAFLRLLRKLGLRGWVRSGPKQLPLDLTMHMTSHGGPITWSELAGLGVPPPPQPVTRLSASDPKALLRSRTAMTAGKGSLLWFEVEDALAPTLRRGVVSFEGQEQPGAGVIRRTAALLRSWAAVIPDMGSHRQARLRVPGKSRVQGTEIHGSGNQAPAAVSISNPGAGSIKGELRAFDPSARKELIIPGVELPPGESMWLPVNLSLARSGLCDDCGGFGPDERVVYATAELQAIEFENGILAFEFAAPAAGHIVVQLKRKPTGPLVAGAKPTDFEWDEHSSAVRLPVPAGKAPAYRVRIGLAIEPPDDSAFFSESPRLIRGRPNTIRTGFSSEVLAARARLLTPPGYTVTRSEHSPLEIDYVVTPPADTVHGELITLAIEADGKRLGRARAPVLQPASVRIMEGVSLHFGPSSQLAVEPAIVPVDATGGRNLTLRLRNNYPSIQNYVIELSGEGLSFSPKRIELSVGASLQRDANVRVFADSPGGGPTKARLRVTGAASLDEEFLVVPLRRGRAVSYSADLDGDGIADWVLENHSVRAAFAGADGRWLEYVWKGTEQNVLPEPGILPMKGPVSIQASQRGSEANLSFTAGAETRTVRLPGGDQRLSIEQQGELSLEALRSQTPAAVELRVEEAPQGVTFTLKQK